MERMTIKYDPKTDTLNSSTRAGATWHREITIAKFQAMQVAVYVMVGGGLIGRMYAEQPADAYIDTRAGRRPYRLDQIEAVRQCLIASCRALGLDPHHVSMPDFPGCWVF